MNGERVKKTALYEVHKRLGAKIVHFADHLMPVYYTSIIDEHRRVRSTVGLFDVSHMGEFEIRGADASPFVQRMTTNDAAALEIDQAQYSVMCYPDGGIVDDLLVYRLEDHFLLVVNAANILKDFEWLKRHLAGDVHLEDRSDEMALLALQGPKAEDVLSPLVDIDLSQLRYYHSQSVEVGGETALISRTGYTGEDGFEIYCHPQISELVWNMVMEAGQRFHIQPVGLGARDTLRLEMRYVLYGSDINGTTNPLEAGLGWVIKFDKGEFIGRDALLEAKAGGLTRKLVGFETEGRTFPRKGYSIRKDGREIGRVTSGTFSPSLGKGIGLGYVAIEHAPVGTEFNLMVRGRCVGARIVKTPFYTQGSHR
ncbi:MAG: glycine cleavage system aminomethyltransferase GcvT [bacterium]